MQTPKHDDIVGLVNDHGLENVVLVKEYKRRYHQHKIVEFVPTENFLRCQKKRRFYYSMPRWKAPNRCTCPVMPAAVAARVNPTYDDEWSSEDDEGVRSFYEKETKKVRAESIATRVKLGPFDVVVAYGPIGARVIKDGALPRKKKARIREENSLLDTDSVDCSPPDLEDFVLVEDLNYLDAVQKILDVDEVKCIHCENTPCSWSVHRAEMVEHAANVLVVDRDDNAEMLSSKRKTLYRMMSHLLNGHMGKGNRKPHEECVKQGIRDIFPDPNGKFMGHRDT